MQQNRHINIAGFVGRNMENIAVTTKKYEYWTPTDRQTTK